MNFLYYLGTSVGIGLTGISFYKIMKNLFSTNVPQRDEGSSSELQRDEGFSSELQRDEGSSSGLQRDEGSSSGLQRDEGSSSFVEILNEIEINKQYITYLEKVIQKVAEIAEQNGIDELDDSANWQWVEAFFRNKIKEAQKSINQKEESLQKLPSSQLAGLKTDNSFISQQLLIKLLDLSKIPITRGEFKYQSNLPHEERLKIVDIFVDLLLEEKYFKAPTLPDQGLRDATVSESSHRYVTSHNP